MKNILMVAYHFPPVRVSSGLQRTLKFSQYLLDYGWTSQVLTVSPRAYVNVSQGQMTDIPKAVYVKRAFALDAAKHLSIKGRYISWVALPDRWASWCFSGFFSGLMMVFRFKPKVIWSTFPIASAQLLAYFLHRSTGIPWVSDLRDPMTNKGFELESKKQKFYRWLENKTVKHSTKIVLTTPSVIEYYAKRFPDVPRSRWVLIPNGFDEGNFIEAENSEAYSIAKQKQQQNKEQLVLLHSGIIYPSERDPTEFFNALAELKQQGLINSSNLKIILRDTGHDEFYIPMLQKCSLQDIVLLEPSIDYKQALAEMMTVDGLLIFQASSCNFQIPAKVYEYLRAKRPVFALAALEGDTAKVLKEVGRGTIVPIDNKDSIIKGLTGFLTDLRAGSLKAIPDEVIKQYSREARTELLAELLAELVP